jgi:hypothetical protein
MDDRDDKDKKDPKKGKLIVLPNGRKVHTGDIGMQGSIVGPSGNVPTAEVVDPTEAERDLREREAYVKRQELVQSATKRGPTGEMIELAIQEIAEELAHLKYERRKTAKEGKPTVQHTIARIAALRNLADVLLKRQENTRAERMDFRSPEFKKVVHEWLAFMDNAMQKAGLGENEIDLVFKQIQADMADWEKSVLENAS